VNKWKEKAKKPPKQPEKFQNSNVNGNLGLAH